MATPYGTQIERYAGGLNNLKRRYQGMGQTAGAGLAAVRPMQQRSLTDLASLLRQPERPGARAAFINRRTQPVSDAYTAGQAALTARAAREGDNSFLAGQRAVLEGQRANAFGMATNDAAQNFDAQRQQNLESLYRLFTGQQQQEQEAQRYALGQEGDANSQLLQLYLQMSNAEKQRAAAAQQNRLGALGSLIGTGAQIYGMSRGWGK